MPDPNPGDNRVTATYVVPEPEPEPEPVPGPETSVPAGGDGTLPATGSAPWALLGLAALSIVVGVRARRTAGHPEI